MAGCVPCFIIPLLLFLFHRFIQPILLKYWNPWEKKELKNEAAKENKTDLLTPSAPPQEGLNVPELEKKEL